MFAGVLQHNYKGFIMAISETSLLHKNLTDPQLHEPAWISTADENTVYLANGAGSGTWKKITFEEIDFVQGSARPVEVLPAEDIEELAKGDLPAFTPVSHYVDNNSFGDVNRNFYESLTKIEQLRNSLAIAHTNITALTQTVTELREALINAGVILNG